MQARLYKRGKVWWCWYYCDGQQIRESTRCTDQKAAEQYLKGRERSPYLPENKTLDSAISDFLSLGVGDLSSASVRFYKQKCGHLSRLLTGEFLPVQKDVVLKYIKSRLDEGASRSTVSKELIALRRVLKQANSSIDFPPFRSRYVPRETFLTLEEFCALRDQIPARRLWLTLSVCTGARYSEIGLLDWAHVDLVARTILIPGRKTAGSRRVIPISDDLYHELSQCTDRHGPLVERWINVRRDLNAACRRAGIDKRISPNDLRRTFASWLVQGKAPTFAVAKLLGHSTSRMVELVYGRLNQDALRETMAVFPKIKP